MLDYSFFATRLEESFQVGAGPLRVKGVACEKLTAHPGGRVDPYAVHFLGPANPVLPQQIYTLSSDESGAFDIFLVPVERKAEGLLYEAVFN